MLDAAELVSELEANPSLLNDVDKDGNNIPLTLFSLCVSSFLSMLNFMVPPTSNNHGVQDVHCCCSM